MRSIINRLLDRLVLRGGYARLLGQRVHPYLILLNVSPLAALAVSLSSIEAMPTLRLDSFVASFLLTFMLYEGVYLPFKGKLMGVLSRSLLLDLCTFFLPAYCAWLP
jgi:hypothetical protein